MIKDLIQSGTLIQIEEGNLQEQSKIGRLRGGSCGMVRPDGEIIGACAATAYARYKGFNGSAVTLSKELMFAGGRANEDLWLKSLKKSYNLPGQVILCEEEIPLVWTTDNGVKVTGRPDIVLCESADMNKNEPVCLLELKQIMASYSAYNVLIKKTPMLKHVIQAAWYTYQLGCKGELWYTSRQNITCDAWMDHSPRFPSPGQPGSEYFKYRYYRLGDVHPRSGKPTRHKSSEEEYYTLKKKERKAEVKNFLPFLQGFLLDIHGGQVYIKDDMNPHSKWMETCVNIDDIKRWYNYIAELETSTKVVPPTYRNVDIWGEEIGFKFDSEFGSELDPAKWVGKPLELWLSELQANTDTGSVSK